MLRSDVDWRHGEELDWQDVSAVWGSGSVASRSTLRGGCTDRGMRREEAAVDAEASGNRPTWPVPAPSPVGPPPAALSSPPPSLADRSGGVAPEHDPDAPDPSPTEAGQAPAAGQGAG